MRTARPASRTGAVHGQALSARSTSRPKAATRTMSPARGIVAGTTGIIEMSNGRPTMRNYLDRMHDQTLAHVASLSNSDILSKSLDEWVAQLGRVLINPLCERGSMSVPQKRPNCCGA